MKTFISVEDAKWLDRLRRAALSSPYAKVRAVYETCASYIADIAPNERHEWISELHQHLTVHGFQFADIPRLVQKHESFPEWATGKTTGIKMSASQTCAVLGLMKLQEFCRHVEAPPQDDYEDAEIALTLLTDAAVLASWAAARPLVRKTRATSKAKATKMKSDQQKSSAGGLQHQAMKASALKLYFDTPHLHSISAFKAADWLIANHPPPFGLAHAAVHRVVLKYRKALKHSAK